MSNSSDVNSENAQRAVYLNLKHGNHSEFIYLLFDTISIPFLQLKFNGRVDSKKVIHTCGQITIPSMQLPYCKDTQSNTTKESMLVKTFL